MIRVKDFFFNLNKKNGGENSCSCVSYYLNFLKCCWVGNRLLHVSRARVKFLHLLRRWEPKPVRLREPRLQYHSTKEMRRVVLYHSAKETRFT